MSIMGSDLARKILDNNIDNMMTYPNLIKAMQEYAKECVIASLDYAALGLDQPTYEYITSQENIILL